MCMCKNNRLPGNSGYVYLCHVFFVYIFGHSTLTLNVRFTGKDRNWLGTQLCHCLMNQVDVHKRQNLETTRYSVSASINLFTFTISLPV